MGDYQGMDFNKHLDGLLAKLVNSMRMPSLPDIDKIIGYKKHSAIKDSDDKAKEISGWYSLIITQYNNKKSSYSKHRFKGEIKRAVENVSDVYTATVRGVEVKKNIVFNKNPNMSDEEFELEETRLRENYGLRFVDIDKEGDAKDYENALAVYYTVLKKHLLLSSK